VYFHYQRYWSRQVKGEGQEVVQNTLKQYRHLKCNIFFPRLTRICYKLWELVI
jgi:hypothetical protein